MRSLLVMKPWLSGRGGGMPVQVRLSRSGNRCDKTPRQRDHWEGPH